MGPVEGGPEGTGATRVQGQAPRAATAAVPWLLWLALALTVLLSSWDQLVPDTKPEVYLAPGPSFLAYLSAWQENPQLGFPSFNVGLAPVAGVMWAVQAVGVPPELAVRLLRLAALSGAALGAAHLLRTVAPEGASRLVRTVAAVVYVANPYVVVAGATLPVLLPYAVLPWLLAAVLRMLRSDSGWRGPAVAALLLAAMTGMNAGVVPVIQLLALVPVLAHVRAAHRVPWRRHVAPLLRWAALSLLLSAYWLVPALSALGAGTVVIDSSESAEGIAAVSALSEVLRGLGLWPLYGGDAGGPWVPEHVGYLVEPVLVVLSSGFAVLLAVSTTLARGPVRRLGLALVVVAALVMVGLFPLSGPTGFGQVLRWVFDHVPGAAALRTTNKAGAVLVLGVALLTALAAAQVRRWPSPRRRAAAAAGLALVLAGGTLPAWTGGLYTSRLDVPDYWTAAAAEVNGGAPDERVWLVPGGVLASYRWSDERPDDLNNSLLTRPSLSRTVIPVTSAEGANLLAAVDGGLHEGTLGPGVLSAAARYLGVGDVLLRHDLADAPAGAAAPTRIHDQAVADPGLVPRGTFGRPGENLADPGATLPPVEHLEVADAVPVVRAKAASRTVTVVGDGFAFPRAVEAGLLEGDPPLRYLGAEGSLHGLLGSTHRILLTDTNRRRTARPDRLSDGHGPLLPPGRDPGPTRALGEDPDAQTVLRVEGARVGATAVGSVFGSVPAASPENAVDGDPGTAWQLGDFGSAVGATLTVASPELAAATEVVVRTAALGPVSVASLRISSDGWSTDVPVGSDGTARTELPELPELPERAADGAAGRAELSVEVLSTAGEGYNRVGISEVEVPGVQARRVARLPVSLQAAAARLGAADRARLAQTPLDVVLSRVRSGATGAGEAPLPFVDEETTLHRDLALPDDRAFRVYGLVRSLGGAAVPAPDAEGCLMVATLDGDPLRMRPVLPVVGQAPTLWTGCGPGVALGAGEHRLRGVAGFAADTLVLRDLIGDRPAENPAAAAGVDEEVPELVVADRRGPRWGIEVSGAGAPYVLVLGQAFDPRWTATIDGVDLGPPTVVDGYSAGWVVDGPPEHALEVTYGPQGPADLALGVSVLALVGCALLLASGSAATSGASATAATTQRPGRGTGGRARAVLTWGAAALAAWFLAGAPAVLGVVVAAARCRWAGRAGVLLWSGVGLLALAPVAYLVGNADRLSAVTSAGVTPGLVSGNLWPHRLAVLALVLLVAGVLQQEGEPADAS